MTTKRNFILRGSCFCEKYSYFQTITTHQFYMQGLSVDVINNTISIQSTYRALRQKMS